MGGAGDKGGGRLGNQICRSREGRERRERGCLGTTYADLDICSLCGKVIKSLSVSC